MPQERPRHEPLKSEGRNDHERSYDEREKQLRGKGIVNADPPKRDKKPRPRPAEAVIASLQASLSASNAALKATLPAFLARPEAAAVCAEMNRYRGDLAGAFNDRKLERAADLPPEGGGSAEQVALRKLFDWLQFSENEGKLADCLEQWNEAARGGDWERMAALSDAIGQGIAYDKAIVREWFESYGDDAKDRLEPDRDAVHALLDGIAYEVSREADLVLVGDYAPADAGRRIVAAHEALDRSCDRRSRANAIAASVDALQPSGEIAKWSAGYDAEVNRAMAAAKTALAGWEAAAAGLSNVAASIAGGVDPGPQRQVAEARRLDALGGLSQAMLDLLAVDVVTVAASSGLTAWAKDDLVFTLHQLASGIVEKHRSLASQLTEPAAQALLNGGKGMQALKDSIARVEDDRKKVDTLYEQARAAAFDGKLRDYWSGSRDALFDRLRQLSRGSDKALARWADGATDELKRLFTDDLGPTLDKWKDRSGDDIYGLTWQLVDTLRRYKAGTVRVLAGAPTTHAFMAEYARQVLDSVMAAVAADLDRSMEWGTV